MLQMLGVRSWAGLLFFLLKYHNSLSRSLQTVSPRIFRGFFSNSEFPQKFLKISKKWQSGLAFPGKPSDDKATDMFSWAVA